MTSYNEKIKKLGYKSSREYRDHLAQEKGYKDFNDYRQWWRRFRKCAESAKCKPQLLSELI